MTTASIHHIAGAKERPAALGGLDLPENIAKLDRVLDAVGQIKVDIATLVGDMRSARESNARQEREVERVKQTHDADMKDVRREIETLRERPPGLTGRQLWAGAVSVILAASALASIIDKIHLG